MDALLSHRTEANARFFRDQAPRLARLCHRMAERFARGGRLVAMGASPQARSDARHVAVEFVHPVIVGKRALPALALTSEGGALTVQAATVLRSEDVVLAFGGDDPETGREDALRQALAQARECGCLTVDFADVGAEWTFMPPTGDPFVAQELVETLYHLLWELVHVFFEHRGLLEGQALGPRHDAGASGFLYPFLAQEEQNLEEVLDDVAASVVMKADEVAALRERTLREGVTELWAAARALRRVVDGEGLVLAAGNGGSATDAMDLVADLRHPPRGGPSRRALDLTEDTGILTAVGNDVGMDRIFARQIIAYGAREDALVVFSTSGDSRNVVEALAEARRRGLVSVALLGYDGGRIAARGLSDHVVVAPSEHIPRIQEAQATVYHLLLELMAEPDDPVVAGST